MNDIVQFYIFDGQTWRQMQPSSRSECSKKEKLHAGAHMCEVLAHPGLLTFEPITALHEQLT